MQRRRTADLAVGDDEIDHAEIAGAADATRPVDHRAQSFRHRRPGVEEINIDAARPIVAGRHGLSDAPVPARPADAPRVHLPDAVGAFLAQEPRQAPSQRPRPACSVSSR